MKHGINLNAILAVRAEADYCSEMTSQLLFGEYCVITDEKDGYFKIENCIDKHTGWVATEGLTPISEEEIDNLANSPVIRICVPMAEVFYLDSKTIIRLPMGSFIPNYNPDTNRFSIANRDFQVHSSFMTYLPRSNRDGIVPTAMSLLNTPYLNGGKTLFGMDCSGFVQTVFSVNGYTIPRFSSEQATIGAAIESVPDAEAGDLFFYTKEDVPSHTAIYLGNNRIIHAGNSVKIDEIDDRGNYNKSAYRLYKIKRAE